jgi:hypothetical protein
MKNKDQKRKEGEERNNYWRSLSPDEQLENINQKLGATGATKQRYKFYLVDKQDNKKHEKKLV